MRPTLIINPHSDSVFVESVTAAEDAAVTTAELEVLLRVRYPRATVRARQLSGEQAAVWYVYRDGSWTDPRSGPIAVGGAGGLEPRKLILDERLDVLASDGGHVARHALGGEVVVVAGSPPCRT